MKDFLFKHLKTDTQLEKKLHESEKRYRRLFESAKDGILILDYTTGNIRDANPYILQMIGHPMNKVIGKKLWEIGLFANKQYAEKAFTELKATGYIRFEDLPIQRDDGKITDVEFISNVYLVNSKRVIQCNIREITERKRNEKRQLLTNSILSILNSQNDKDKLVMIILNEIREFTGVEAVGFRLKDGDQYPYYETIGYAEHFANLEKHLHDRNNISNDTPHNHAKYCLENICDDVISGRIDHSLPQYTKGGSFFSNYISAFFNTKTENKDPATTCKACSTSGYESAAIIPLYSGNTLIGLLQMNDSRPNQFNEDMIKFFEQIGISIGIAFNRIQDETKLLENEKVLIQQNQDYAKLNMEYLATNKKLTESLDHIQKINDDLSRAKAKAEESDMLKSAFLSNMSHEIRTPMNAIVGFSEFLSDPELTKEQQEHFVQIINASSQQLLTIISDIIDISKIETGQFIIMKDMVNINELLNELYITYQKLIDLKDLKLNLSCEFPDDDIQVQTDVSRVRQVLCNLLNNALKFTHDGSIEFGYRIQEGNIAFYVKDTGMGIAPENQAIIFKRFRQLEAPYTNTTSGNGLGLSISKAIVEKLGGNISVVSDNGVGSIFTFIIPYSTSNNIQNPDMKDIPEPIAGVKDKTVLIVEDETNNHAYLTQLLSSIHVKVLHAWNGYDAVELVKNHPEITSVLMDIKMPMMDGYEATRQIKVLRPDLPVIAQTAYVFDLDRDHAMQAGCDAYISKPIKKELLIKTLNGSLS